MASVELKPACIFEQFAKISQISCPSKHEEQIISYLQEFAKERNLDVKVDKVGNVLISKPTVKGMENVPTVVLQSRTDMVCDKLVDIEFDFHRGVIRTYVDDEWLRVEGMTLGADDGIGVAYELAILDSNNIEHGPIECLFTRDEGTGLTGAFGLEAGFVAENYLISLDSEDEGQIFVNCADGNSTTAVFNFEHENIPEGYSFMEAGLKDPVGGYSGDGINKKCTNAIKLLVRFLYTEQARMDLCLSYWNSGKMYDTIPHDGKILFAVPSANKETVKTDWSIFSTEVADEFHVTDIVMVWNPESTDAVPVMPKQISHDAVPASQALDNDPLISCRDEVLAYIVETSSNIASIRIEGNKLTIVSLQRLNVMSNLVNMTNTVRTCFELIGTEIVVNDSCPAWKMNSNSRLVHVVIEQYKDIFGKEPLVPGIHTGLECGLFSEKYPHLDMVSFDPILRYVHTSDECLFTPTI